MRKSGKVRIIREATGSGRIATGLEKVAEALECRGFQAEYMREEAYDSAGIRDGISSIYVGTRREGGLIRKLEEEKLLLYHTKEPEGEGFYLAFLSGMNLFVAVGGTETGALYGALELAERIRREESDWVADHDLAYGDAPVFRLRGPAVGLQLTKVEPPRLTYEYPITPARFPWFYEKEMWEKFLDQLLEERCNVLYLWTGQPFSSLVKLEDYPEALEVTEEEYEKNREMFSWLTEACDRRGIWLVLKFYSIHIPLPLAEKYHVDLLQSNITELNRDYTYQSIVKFIASFPHIGLMVCLGEALRGLQNKTDWFIKTIIPAVKEGVALAGLEELPPLILRGHDCDPNAVMEQAVPLYENLYTMWKYNGEGLTTYLPTGKWQDTHVRLASHGQTHIMNVHVVADLEPFRYGATEFIQKCMQAGRSRLGCNGLHLYPLFFWDWPYSPDKGKERLLQAERDWLWYRAWFRYAWNPDRDPETERLYWREVFAEHFSTDMETADRIYRAVNAMGQCAPRILRRVGITEGNRQTMSLGMTMSQFTNVKRYKPNYELWHSVSTPGEQPDDEIRRELAGEPFYGETTADMCAETVNYAKRAEELLCSVQGKAGKNRQELEYWFTDAQAMVELTLSYAKKLEAAFCILRYKYTMDENLRGDLGLLRAAVAPWEESMEHYRRLAGLTESTYLYACSMQTRQRKIPFTDGSAFGHWSQCLPEYEKEFDCFKKHLKEMEQGIFPGGEEGEEEQTAEPLMGAPFELEGSGCETYTVKKGESIFTDMVAPITMLAPELKGLTGIRFGLGSAMAEGARIVLKVPGDVKVLIAYMNAGGVEWLKLPDLETNTHADDRGGLSVVYANALQAENCPNCNIHAYFYEKGTHEIYMGTGGFTIVGVVPADADLQARNAGLSGETPEKLDWLYEM
ncbi:MAG TPA: hypothetical protein DCZ91_03100 [Lachnospiraceae bacterium]|nr:hypothetical protein [Lachnospiraceae bacterium]